MVSHHAKPASWPLQSSGAGTYTRCACLLMDAMDERINRQDLVGWETAAGFSGVCSLWLRLYLATFRLLYVYAVFNVL